MVKPLHGRSIRSILSCTVLIACAICSLGAEPASQSGGPATDAADQLATVIDQRIADGWRRNNVEPTPLADDPEFLRRTYLNLVGRIPSIYEAREFLEDSSPYKRRELVDRLLTSPGYLSNFTRLWRDVIVPEASNNVNPFARFPDVLQFETWLRDRLDQNAGYDRIAHEVISGTTGGRTEGSPAAFIRLKESKPENLAAGTSRAFLGVRLECAQCHDHPFAKWHREDFWKLAAFFGGVPGTGGDAAAGQSGVRSIKIPDTDKVVDAAFLDEPSLRNSPTVAPRTALASWITSRDNTYFARATVNRVWGHFFGMGIIEPVDDFDDRNPASHPELLDDLARAFIEHNYDLRFLVRAITRSRPYQLGSRRTHESQQDPRLFSRMLVKGLTSDQLFDSLIWATGYAEDQSNGRNVFALNGQREQFRELFGQQVSNPGEVQTSILQALLMLNGEFVDQATSPERSMTLSAIADFPFFDNQQRIETLFLAALARPPRPGEASSLLKYVEESSRPQQNRQQGLAAALGGLVVKPHVPKAPEAWKHALGDVYWALLNSSEFSLNH